MKATIVLFLMGFLAIGLKAQNLKISGKVDADVLRVTLKVFNGESLSYDAVERADVSNGKYDLETSFDQPNLYQLDFSGKLNVTLSYTDETAVEVDYLDGMLAIRGSEASGDMQDFEAQNGKLQMKHFAQLKKDADEAMKNNDKEALEEIQARSAKAIQAFVPELRAWIESKGISPAGYHALGFSDFNKEIDYIASHLKNFERELPNSPVTKALAARVYRSQVLSIGQKPPVFAAKDSNGEAFSYEQYQGKVLLVDFWAAWCRACRIENPQFVELYNEFNSKGFEVVSVSQDRDAAVWEKAIEKDGVGIWTNIQDKSGEISELYAISSLPQNLVIGKDGNIIGKNVTAKQLRDMISNLQ